MFATTTVLIMVIGCTLACAISVGSCLKTLSLVGEMRSLRSLQGEIAEIDDCVGSLLKTVRRIEGRQTATMGRASTSSATPVTTSDLDHMDKAALRRYAGLIPGKPVKTRQPADGNTDSPP